MRGPVRFALILIVAVLTLLLYRSHRIHVRAEQASEFAPAAAEPILVPAGTRIQAGVWGTGIPESAAVGDDVTAFVVPPIAVDGKTVIATTGRLKGKLEEVTINDSRGRARINFTSLLIRDKVVSIQARPVVVVAPVESDFGTIGLALRTLMGASLGASVGASSGDQNLVDRGLVEGAMTTMPNEAGLHITIVLTRDLNL